VTEPEQEPSDKGKATHVRGQSFTQKLKSKLFKSKKTENKENEEPKENGKRQAG